MKKKVVYVEKEWTGDKTERSVKVSLKKDGYVKIVYNGKDKEWYLLDNKKQAKKLSEELCEALEECSYPNVLGVISRILEEYRAERCDFVD